MRYGKCRKTASSLDSGSRLFDGNSSLLDSRSTLSQPVFVAESKPVTDKSAASPFAGQKVWGQDSFDSGLLSSSYRTGKPIQQCVTASVYHKSHETNREVVKNSRKRGEYVRSDDEGLEV